MRHDFMSRTTVLEGCPTICCESSGSVEQGDWPKKAVLKSYDLVEKGGFVWMFNGNKAMPMNARPPIPFVPEVPPPPPSLSSLQQTPPITTSSLCDPVDYIMLSACMPAAPSLPHYGPEPIINLLFGPTAGHLLY